MIRLLLKEIVDTYVRKNFENIQKFVLSEHIVLCGFKHFEVEFTKAETNLKIPHGLKYQPKDVLITSKTGAGVLTLNYELFTTTTLDVTVTAACKVRGFIGAYGGN